MDNINDYTGLPLDVGKENANLGASDIVNVLMAILAGGGGGGGGGGDASASNQLIQIDVENYILNNISDMNQVQGTKSDSAWNGLSADPTVVAILKAIWAINNNSFQTGVGNNGLLGAIEYNTTDLHADLISVNYALQDILTRNPTLGQKAMSDSVPIVIAVDQPALPVTLTNQTIAPTAMAGAFVNPISLHSEVSTATTNATSVKTSATSIASLAVSNNGATPVYFKIYNRSTAPVMGTSVPVKNIMIPPMDSITINNALNEKYGAGLAYAITAGIALLDNTPVLADQCTVNISYV